MRSWRTVLQLSSKRLCLMCRAEIYRSLTRGNLKSCRATSFCVSSSLAVAGNLKICQTSKTLIASPKQIPKLHLAKGWVRKWLNHTKDCPYTIRCREVRAHWYTADKQTAQAGTHTHTHMPDAQHTCPMHNTHACTHTLRLTERNWYRNRPGNLGCLKIGHAAKDSTLNHALRRVL